MNKSITVITTVLLLTFEIPIFAADESLDDALISDIAKKENVSVEYVKDALANGCDSGITPRMNECANYLYAGADIQLNRSC